MLKSIMKRLFITLLFCMPALAYADPSIKFVNVTHDFGHVMQDEQAEYTFEFTNEGTDELIIERIESS